MNAEIKQYADKGDVRALKYYFVDSLVVDPTFESIEDTYQYCCENVSGFWQDYVEMTPLKSDSKEWTKDYFNQLKLDLNKNFAEKRFSHMRKVAKVAFADKVERLKQERMADAAPKSQPVIADKQQKTTQSPVNHSSVPSRAEQEKALAEEKARLDREYKEAREREQQAAARIRSERVAQQEQDRVQAPSSTNAAGAESKKALGIVIAAAAVAAVAATIILLSR